MLHKFGHIDLDNLNMEKSLVNPYQVYCNTKLANLLFTKELSRRIANTRVTVNACHPGMVQTGITQELWYWKYLLSPIIYPLFAKTLTQGAQTMVHLALSPTLEVVSGKYFNECREVNPSAKCFDAELARQLWELSEKLTCLKFHNYNSKI